MKITKRFVAAYVHAPARKNFEDGEDNALISFAAGYFEQAEREAHAAGVIEGRTAATPLGMPTDEDISALVKPIWLSVKPNREAQTIRSSLSIEFDDPRWKVWVAEFIPEYVWDLVDIAAQRGSAIAEEERQAIARSAREHMRVG